MKIGSTIKPRDGKPRNVHVHGELYPFAPVKDKHGKTHFVAEVNVESHAEVLMASDAFYHYDESHEVVPELTRNPDPKPVPVKSAEPVFSAEILAEAAELLKGAATSISTAVGSVSSLDVVKAALALENANAKPRKNVTELLQSTLDMAKEALQE
ncbi:MAG: hypothetical protein WA777_12705 [Rhodanobacter sp.]